MNRGTKNLYTMIDDWVDKKVTVNNENWYSIINKGEINGITNDVSIIRNRVSDLETQLEELKAKKKRRKLKIKVKM